MKINISLIPHEYNHITCLEYKPILCPKFEMYLKLKFKIWITQYNILKQTKYLYNAIV